MSLDHRRPMISRASSRHSPTPCWKAYHHPSNGHWKNSSLRPHRRRSTSSSSVSGYDHGLVVCKRRQINRCSVCYTICCIDSLIRPSALRWKKRSSIRTWPSSTTKRMNPVRQARCRLWWTTTPSTQLPTTVSDCTERSSRRRRRCVDGYRAMALDKNLLRPLVPRSARIRSVIKKPKSIQIGLAFTYSSTSRLICTLIG